MTVVLRGADGAATTLAVDDWSSAASDDELELLRSVHGPVVDLGCGPGRLVVALQQMGTPALGVDASPYAIAHASASGASVLHRSLFERLPGEGRWRTALLLDGNVGIGGDPVALMRRVRTLLGAGGRAIVEVLPPGVATRLGRARLEREAETTPWFPWAWVGVDSFVWIARCAAMRVVGWHHAGGRWFALVSRGDVP